ncbi:phage integrase SAM-like domain-containing protein [Flammeovirgaceae bacterium SG7u.111]|nr:phage integrase SAM-like domain-containing protein [Flammeovirgaceae bacterium SG7u.132]WPO33952.1 phage integrase SAM-like domain-containing protein [Flammeovirgaceae bacterium SG7u.111]
MVTTTIQFRFRNTCASTSKGVVYAKVTHKGVHSNYFSTGINTTKNKWVNRSNSRLGKKIERIRIELLDATKKANYKLELVREVWRDGNKPVTLFAIAKEVVKLKGQDRTLKYRTWETYDTRLKKLEQFDTSTPIKKINEKWANNYLAWCLHKGYKRNYCMKQIQFVKHVLKHAKKEGIIKTNKLEYYDFKYEKKPIEFLTVDEIQKLQGISFASPALNKVKVAFLFQMYLGLSYEGLEKFRYKDLKTYRDKKCYVKQRDKSMETYFVPLCQEALQLLEENGFEIPLYCNAYYNRILKEIALILAIDLKLTTHLARKTAGMRWLNMGYSIESVSLMLDHSDIRTTQRWYARVLPIRVLEETEKIEAKNKK